MKALFVGLGAIGQRHVRNLKRVYTNNLEIIALRREPSNLIIKSDMSTETCENIESYYGIRCLYDFDSALKEKPDIAFITNPSSFHVPAAIKLAKIGCHLFIEKPLSVNLEGIHQLRKISEQKNIKIFVGFQLRFYSLLRQVRDLLDDDSLGNLLYAKAKFGTYLPLHHPYEDYKTGYAAREDLGGGVIMCLMHEIDYVYYLFGLPRHVVAFGGKLSDLEMSAEDTANIAVRYENNFSANIILSFAERKEERTLQIVGDKGKIDLDFCEHRLQVYNAGRDIFEEFRSNDVDRNDLFADEIKHFINCIENGQALRTDLNDAINSLKIALAVKNSMTQNRMIAL